MDITKYQNIIQKVNYFSLLLFVFWLPLKDNYLPAIMTLWIFTWLLQGNFKTRFDQFPEKKYFVGFLVYFFLTSFYLYRANDFDYGLFNIQEKLSMIFFPIIIVGSNSKIKENKIIILKVFVLANFVASVYCLTNATMNSIVLEHGSYILNHNLSDYYNDYSFWKMVNMRYSHFAYTYLSIFKHPSYFSSYLIFAIVIIIYFFKNRLIKNNLLMIAYALLIVFFVIMIYLLQSRAGIICLGVTFIFLTTIELKKKMKKKYHFLALALVGLGGFLVFTNAQINKNISQINKLFEEGNISNLSESEQRLQLWYTSTKVIKDNFWFGTSPANLTDELVKKYEELGFENAADDGLNTHSQYLESFAGLGILGFLSLMFVMVYTFIISIRKRHYLLFFLMLILSINFLFEAMLNRMAGILFMMFFISLFVFTRHNNKEVIETTTPIEE